MTATPADVRNTITPEAFRLDPALLGTPLARPWRRGAAMAVDGVLIALLSNAPSVLFAFAGAWILLRISGKQVEGSYLRRGLRTSFRLAGAVMLFVALIAGWNGVSDRLEGVASEGLSAFAGDQDATADEESEPSGDEGSAGAAAGVTVRGAGDGRANLTGMDGMRLAKEVGLFTQAGDEAAARRRAEAVVLLSRRAGMSDDDIRETLVEMSANPERPWLAAAVDSVVAGFPPPVAAAADASPADSLLAAYAAALAVGDLAGAAAVRPALVGALAADSLEALRERLAEQRRELAASERAREDAEEELEAGPGLMATLRRFADDLGLGLGWAGLYFTAFVTLWQGRTPGKRLLGIRVIRLDGKPIGWWAAFERFGGYAAGVVTGLLGFVQILWDRNRQAVQDKISETVVIRAPRR